MKIIPFFSAVIFAGIILFQILLIMGKPWGKYAWGGMNPGILPAKLRIASGFSVLILVFFIFINVHSAGLISVTWSDTTSNVFTWIVTLYSGLGILMNGISRSREERMIWTPVTALLFALNLPVSLRLIP